MKLVLDTNIMVSALLSPHGPPGQLLDLVLDGHLQPVLSPAIQAEYREVLLRPRFGFDAQQVDLLLGTLDAFALHVFPLPWPHLLPDIDDEPFLASAHHAQALLVTGNERDYPLALREGVLVLSPRAALEQMRSRLTTKTNRLHEERPRCYVP